MVVAWTMSLHLAVFTESDGIAKDGRAGCRYLRGRADDEERRQPMAEHVDRPRVVVIDGDGDVRALLETMLEVAEDLELVGASAGVDTGVALVAGTRPDAVVLDLDPDEATGGMDAIVQLREACPEARIVVISSFPDPLTLVHVLRQGADEYLDKARVWADLLPAILHLCEAASRR
jgi:DNA-binding NarL/FixJ family response regulator